MAEHQHLDVNAATRAEFVAGGVMPAMADRIVRHRAERGPIRSETELYELCRDNAVRLDQLMGMVAIRDPADQDRGYSR